MTGAEFREYGHALVDWIADYWAGVERLPVTSDVVPGQISAALPDAAPWTGESLSAILADVGEIVVPGLTHWQHPGFLGYFPSNTSGASVLGDLLSAGLGVQGMLWSTSPACTELETVVLDWLAELVGLPERFRSGSAGGGVIQDSASSATLVATVAALHRAGGEQWRTAGTPGHWTVYASREAHSSVVKAARIVGLGDHAVRLVDVDPTTLAMDPQALADLLVADRAAGRRPVMVTATVGTTSTTAVDPVRALGEICREQGLWLHVDAAYAGAAAVCPEYRWLNDGAELIDSYCFDPHKWLLTGWDCDAFWVADRAELTAALAIVPEFLRNAASESGEVTDYRDWQIPLGRRFRSLKLWFVLRWYGAEGLRAHIRHQVALAQEFATWVTADPGFELAAPHPLSLVCFRLAGPDADRRTEDLLARCNATRRMFLSHTRVAGRYTIRLAVGAPGITADNLRQTWATIRLQATTESPV
ncbi:MAG: pyridoxal-dependent decarboxylase [Pseudonocardiaceae bacterium]